jgi:TRAP-type uncharacterized transport system substrate-binding protein
MICIGRRSPLVSELIQEGDWKLIPIPSHIRVSAQHPALKTMTIQSGEFAEGQPAAEILTVGTTAFLAAREDTPSELVIAFLKALYADPPPCQGLIPRDQVTEWHPRAFHPAARRFFGLDEGS